MSERRDYEKFYKELKDKKLNFDEALAAFGDKLLPAQVTALTAKVTLELLDRVVAKTPVDKGIARANWNVGIGKADLSTADDDGRDPIAAGEAVLKKLPSYSPVVVSNNMQYIGALERGHSKQAPKGMLGSAIDEVAAIFRKK